MSSSASMRCSPCPKPKRNSSRGPVLWIAASVLLLALTLAPGAAMAQNPDPVGASSLARYPRPRQDNGWGVHWAPTLVTQPQDVVDRYLREVDAMDLRWLKIMQGDQPALEHVYLLGQLRQRGIEPVLRIYKMYNDPYQHLASLVPAGVAAGVHYYELYTNPNVAGLDGGWRTGEAIDVARLAQQWIQAAQTIQDAGGYPGLPSLSPNGTVEDTRFLRDFLAELRNRGRLDLLEQAWLPVQNYTGNRPLDDPRGFRRFEVYHQILVDQVGLSLPIISTEGGTVIGDVEEPGLPPVTEQMVAQRTVDAYRFMATEAPDYYFAFMPWLLVNMDAGGYSSAWEDQAWFPAAGRPRAVVQAVKQLAAQSTGAPPPESTVPAFPTATPDPFPAPFPTPVPTPGFPSYPGYYGSEVQTADAGNVDAAGQELLQPNGTQLDAPEQDDPGQDGSSPDASAVSPVEGASGAEPTASAPQVLSHGDVTLREGSVTLPTYGFEQALLPSTPQDPIWPAPRLDQDRVGPPQPRTYRTIELENDYLRLVILPELGGRIYRWIDKLTGRDILYFNSVVKPTPWGVRGWWLALGGMEWSLPLPDHGLYEYQAWDVETVAEERSASVHLKRAVGDGLEATIQISLSADQRFFAVTIQLNNTGAEEAEVHFWNNAMLAPGQGNTVSPEMRLVWPAEQVSVHSSGDTDRYPQGAILDWPAGGGEDLRGLGNWPSYLSFFATEGAQSSAAGLVDPDGDLAVIRSFPHRLVPGVKTFFGPGLDPSLWSDGDSRRYFELWGGPSLNFDRPLRLTPRQTIRWTEQWYTVPGLGEFVAANANAALALLPAGNETELRLAVTGPGSAQPGNRLLVRVNGELIFSQAVQLSPETIFTQRLPRPLGRDRWLVQLVDRYNRVLLAYDSRPPVAGPSPQAYQPPQWDERLDKLGIQVVPAAVKPGQSYWKVIQAEFQDPREGGGRHHIYVEVLDENGQRLVGEDVIVGWPDGSTTITTEDKAAPEYAANFPMYGDVGSYYVRMPGLSDKVTGMGLPHGRLHVVYLITFQRVTAPPSSQP